jgi:hypothetical protein
MFDAAEFAGLFVPDQWLYTAVFFHAFDELFVFGVICKQADCE